MEEIWKDVIGYEGLYQISNIGKINSVRKNKILKRVLGVRGYYYVDFHNRGRKRMTIHRLIAIHFIPNLLNHPCINHKNGIKTDNAVENLEWCTSHQNNLHAYRTLKRKAPMKGKLNHTGKAVIQKTVKGILLQVYPSAKEASRATGVNHSSICCVARKSRGCTQSGGYKWEYQ